MRCPGAVEAFHAASTSLSGVASASTAIAPAVICAASSGSSAAISVVGTELAAAEELQVGGAQRGGGELEREAGHRADLTADGRVMVERFAERVSEEIAQLVEDFLPVQRERFATQAARIVTASGIARGLQGPRGVQGSR